MRLFRNLDDGPDQPRGGKHVFTFEIDESDIFWMDTSALPDGLDTTGLMFAGGGAKISERLFALAFCAKAVERAIEAKP